MLGTEIANFNAESKTLYVKDNYPQMTVGKYSYTRPVSIEGSVGNSNILIGNFVSIAWDITLLLGANHDYKSFSTFDFRLINMYGTPPPPLEKQFPFYPKNYVINKRQILIGNDVWIGRGATILSGVQIGNGAVIGANSTVTKNIPPYAVVVGSPPRIIKYRFNDEMIRKLQVIKWWHWNLDKIHENFDALQNIEQTIDQFYSPELEQYDHNSLGDTVRDLKFKGWKIFSTVIDFNENHSMWQSIIRQFSQCQLKNVVLVVHVPNRFNFSEVQQSLSKFYSQQPDKYIFATIGNNIFSIDSLRETDIFITTNSLDSLFALDYLNDKDISVRYPLDDLVFY